MTLKCIICSPVCQFETFVCPSPNTTFKNIMNIQYASVLNLSTLIPTLVFKTAYAAWKAYFCK